MYFLIIFLPIPVPNFLIIPNGDIFQSQTFEATFLKNLGGFYPSLNLAELADSSSGLIGTPTGESINNFLMF
jgi:hypothetical protein